MRRLGLYGGSFDPVHLGHLLVAQAALEEFQLDRLTFIPAARSPFKPDGQPTADAHRLRWLRLALAGESRIHVDDVELRRGGVSYSIDTVRDFSRRFPESRLYWLIGADHVASLPKWRDAAELAGRVEFLVIPRPGFAPATLPPPFRLHELRGFPLAVSSSEIRERVRAGRSLRHLVPDAVAQSIVACGAYRSPETAGS